jgi:hypothetical protein
MASTFNVITVICIYSSQIATYHFKHQNIDLKEVVCRTDPISGQTLTSNELIPNISFRNAIHQFLDYVGMMRAAAAAVPASADDDDDDGDGTEAGSLAEMNIQ